MTDSIKELAGWMGLFGVPTIFGLTTICLKACHRFTKQVKVLMDSQQAQMRSQLLKDYKMYKQRGWVDLDELDDWENAYQKYHCLGANGIMDAKRDELMKMPNIP